MPEKRSTVPVGVLAKGSISQLVKATRHIATESNIADKEKHLWFELENDIFTDNEIVSTKQAKTETPLSNPVINNDVGTVQTMNVKTLPNPVINPGTSTKQTKSEKTLPDLVTNTNITENKVTADISKALQNKNPTTLADASNEEKSTNILYQLGESYYKRIIVKTPFSIYFEGILTSVNDDFIILITDQLSIVSIPLFCIVSFYIITPD